MARVTIGHPASDSRSATTSMGANMGSCARPYRPMRW